MEQNYDVKTWSEEMATTFENLRSINEMLAAFYYQPLTQDDIDRLLMTDFGGIGGDDDEMSAGLKKIQNYLDNSRPNMRLELNVDYTGAFYGITVYKGKVASPYESVFVSKSGLLNQEPRQKVFEIYKKEALKVEDRFNTPDDHLSFELQFIGLLTEQVAAAFRAGDFSGAAQILFSMQQFLEEHILNWFDSFSNLAEMILKTEFYQGVLLATHGYLDLLSNVIGIAQEDIPNSGVSA